MTIDKPSEHFETKIWTGNGSSQDITGLNFQPDFVWIKERTSTSSHAITDVVRGNTKYLMSNDGGAEETLTDRVTSFNSDGYSLGTSGGVNQSGQGNVGWNWKAGGTAVSNTDGSITSSVSANTTAGFSIVSFTGTGATATVGHGLGSVPKFFIVKSRSAGDWWTYTTVIDGSLDFFYLNSTSAKSESGVSLPTSSVFSVNSSTAPNTENIIAYFFAEIKGYSKFGSYKGNGSTNGTFVYTGFKPAWVMIKMSSSTSNWTILDNVREGYNVDNDPLYANTTSAEGTTDLIDILSNGFKLRSSDASINTSGGTYIYMAFASSPFVTSTGIPCTAR